MPAQPIPIAPAEIRSQNREALGGLWWLRLGDGSGTIQPGQLLFTRDRKLAIVVRIYDAVSQWDVTTVDYCLLKGTIEDQFHRTCDLLNDPKQFTREHTVLTCSSCELFTEPPTSSQKNSKPQAVANQRQVDRWIEEWLLHGEELQNELTCSRLRSCLEEQDRMVLNTLLETTWNKVQQATKLFEHSVQRDLFERRFWIVLNHLLSPIPQFAIG